MFDFLRTAFLALLLLTACSKDKPSEDKPAVPQPAVSEDKKAPEPTAKAQPEPVKAAVGEVEKKPPAPKKTMKPERVSVPVLPPPPEENILVAIRNAESGCLVKPKECRARDLLAAKMTQDIERATELLQKGTDQQKRALRQALLRCSDPSTDSLLVQGLVGADGLLNTKVLDRVKLLRTDKAVAGLKKYLKKAAGSEAVTAIDALGYLPGDQAVKVLRSAFSDKRHAAYRGEICRAMARRLNIDALDAATKLTQRLNATERQLTGCAGAQSAFRMLTSSGGLNLNVEGQRLPIGSVLFYQRKGQSKVVYLDVAPAGTTECSSTFKGDLTLRVPLARTGEPVIGDGVVPEVYYQGKLLGSSGAFLLRLDQWKYIPGSQVAGAVHIAHTRKNDARIILSGRFKGTYCGVIN